MKQWCYAGRQVLSFHTCYKSVSFLSYEMLFGKISKKQVLLQTDSWVVENSSVMAFPLRGIPAMQETTCLKQTLVVVTYIKAHIYLKRPLCSVLIRVGSSQFFCSTYIRGFLERMVMLLACLLKGALNSNIYVHNSESKRDSSQMNTTLQINGESKHGRQSDGTVRERVL